MKGLFQSALEAKIDNEIGNKLASMGNGTAKTFDEYRYWVGYVQGLQSCKELCSEIEREDSDERRSAA